MKKYSLLVLIFSSLVLSGCLDSSKEVQMVKTGNLDLCPSKTVDQMVSGFMGSPSWSSGVSAEEMRFVNIQGEITLHDKPVTALLQFSVDLNAGTFEYNALEFNKIGQNNFMAIGLLKKMCGVG
jgi:hypothetical protein